MLDFEDMFSLNVAKPKAKTTVKVKVDPKTKKPIKVSKSKEKANKQVASALKKKLAEKKPIKNKVSVSIAKKPVAPVTKISVKTPTLFGTKKPVIKTQVVKKVAPVSTIKINKTVANKHPAAISATSARQQQKQLQGQSKSLAKLATINIKSPIKAVTASPAKKIADIKKTVKEIKKIAPAITSKDSKKKVAKAAVAASKVSNKPEKVIAQKAALPDTVIKEEKITLPAITEVLNDTSTPPKETSLILGKLNDIQKNIVQQQDDAFRNNVLTKLKSIDNKVRVSTLGYQGSLGHIKQDALV